MNGRRRRPGRGGATGAASGARAPGNAPQEEGAATRSVALEVLARVEDDGAYANLALGPALGRSDLDERDRAFVTDLVYGTVRRRRALDHLVDRFLTDPPPPAARRALRLGTYQLAERTDIPAYAAVSSTVAAAPRRFRGLVNAVLRRVADAPLEYPDEATELSYPDWVVDRLVTDLGRDRAFGALASMNEPARSHVRDDGYVQDPASQMVAAAVVDALPPGRTADRPALVADLCAAPGGKSTAVAGSPGVWVLAADLAPVRVGLVVANAARVGVERYAAVVADAEAPPLRPGSMDAVLVDAPCSGLGVLRRRADARWRVDEGAPERLAAIQRRMVDAAVDLLAPGGVLTYSVCTLTAAESLGIDDHVAERQPDLEPVAPPDGWEPWGRGGLLLPQSAGTDGMVLFRYRLPGPS